jgi:hypothetical protein
LLGFRDKPNLLKGEIAGQSSGIELSGAASLKERSEHGPVPYSIRYENRLASQVKLIAATTHNTTLQMVFPLLEDWD